MVVLFPSVKNIKMFSAIHAGNNLKKKKKKKLQKGT
jgi:hypothetical protein